MYRDIIDGYIFDVTKSLPRKERDHVEEILYDEIYIRLDEEMENKPYENPTNEDVKEILNEVGTPIEVVERFTSIDSRSMIPQPYLRHFKMDKALAFIFFMATVVGIQVWDYLVNGLNYTNLIITAGGLISGFVVQYFLYSYFFNKVVRRRVGKNTHNYIENLWARPKKGNSIGKFSVVFHTLLSTVLFGLFAYGYKILNIEYPSILLMGEVKISILPLIYVAYGFYVKSIVYKEVDRRYTLGVLVSVLFTNISIIVVSGILFGLNNTVDPRVYTLLEGLLPDSALTYLLLSNLGIAIFLVTVTLAIMNLVYTAISFHSDKKKFTRYEYMEEQEDTEKEYYHEPIRKEDEFIETETTPEETTVVDVKETTTEETKVVEPVVEQDTASVELTKEEKTENKIAQAVMNANPDNR